MNTNQSAQYVFKNNGEIMKSLAILSRFSSFAYFAFFLFLFEGEG